MAVAVLVDVSRRDIAVVVIVAEIAKSTALWLFLFGLSGISGDITSGHDEEAYSYQHGLI